MKRIIRAALAVALVAGTAAGCASDAPLELPVPEEQPTPFVYPEHLWDEDVEGQVVVMVHVTTEGTVDSVYVRSTSGYAEMDSAALAGARQLRFRPGMRGAEPVPVWVRLPVRFSKSPPAQDEQDAAEDPAAGGASL